MTDARDKLTRQLSYGFARPSLLDDALTHRSAGSRNNERLEFLGDAALNFVIAGELFDRYPDASEGELSRLRASLVNRDSLAVLGRDLELGDHLKLGAGELKSGGYRRASILADAVEAILGAVFLDGGYEACKSLVLRLYRNVLSDLPDLDSLKDPKTRLQEFLQSRRLPLPEYRVIEVIGESHDQTFVVECHASGLAGAPVGRGNSRRKAEQDAAAQALSQLGNG